MRAALTIAVVVAGLAGPSLAMARYVQSGPTRPTKPLGRPRPLAAKPLAGLPFTVAERSSGSLIPIPGTRLSSLREAYEQQGTRLIVVRHGKTRSNARADLGVPVLNGQRESVLNAQGRRQAREAADLVYQQLGGDRWLITAASDRTRLPVIYSSPLSRARATAGSFCRTVARRARSLGLNLERLPVITDCRILEHHYGVLEGKPLAEFASRFPRLHQHWESYKGEGVDFLHRFPGGESRLDVLKRVRPFLEEVQRQHPGRTVIMYSHLETIAAAKILMGHVDLTPKGRLHVVAGAIKNATPIRLTR